MYIINLSNVMVQFDNEHDTKESVLEAIECINDALLRAPSGLGAQLFVDYENLQFEATEDVEEEEGD